MRNYLWKHFLPDAILILLGLFFVTAAVFILSPDKRAPEPSQGKTIVKKTIVEKAVVEKEVFTPNEIILAPGHTEAPDAVKAGQKKLGYNFGIKNTTGRGDVRTSNAKIGVDYKVSEHSTVGVEASRGLHDSQDASAWGKSVEDETAAQAKYKVSF